MHLTNLLRLHPDRLAARHLHSACAALRHLIEDTRLPKAQELRDLGALLGPISIDDRPRYRAL